MKPRCLWVACALAWSACAGSSCHPGTHAKPVVRVIDVPRAHEPPHRKPPLLNGFQWGVSYHGDPFLDSKGLPFPHTHMQFMADDAKLYVGFYAADQDLRTKPRPNDARGAVGDRLTLNVGALEIVLDPKGGPVPPGVTLTTDVDGTIDDSHNDDEEWLVQLDIPWELLGPRAKEDGVLVRAVRTDAPKRMAERALAWPAGGYAKLVFHPS